MDPGVKHDLCTVNVNCKHCCGPAPARVRVGNEAQLEISDYRLRYSLAKLNLYRTVADSDVTRHCQF